jgi:hypothetical protein
MQSLDNLFSGYSKCGYLPVIHNQAEAGKFDDFRRQTASHGPEWHPVLTQHVVMKFP